MSEALRPSDKQLVEWRRFHDFWTDEYSDSQASFPAYYSEEYHQYIVGMIDEIAEYRAFKRGEWAGVE